MRLWFGLATALFTASLAVCQTTDCDTVEKCQAALTLIHYRLGEIYFDQKNYQSAANQFREALNGDLDPKWVEVWAHLNLGKIFDLSQQRERALNEYRLALRTGDNTRGALDEARKHIQEPYSGN
jgi:tetratricopeptide (TPR) repeat protein